MMKTLRRSAFALLFAGLAAAAASAETRVYRCEEGGQVTYADFPCPGAQALSVNAGNAAPDARERLKRDQDALDARAAQRRDALARQEAFDRMEALRARAEAQAAAPAPDDYTYPAYGYGVWPVEVQRDRARRDERERERRRRDRSRSVITVPPPQHVTRH
jgi:hypothetical protein